MHRSYLTPAVRHRTGCRAGYILAAAASVMLFGTPAWSQSAIDKEADDILLASTNYLKGLKTLSVDYDADHEIVDKTGQKIQYSASGSITASRAKGFRMTRKGPYADVEVTFDGKVISLFGKGLNAYAQIESPDATIDGAVEEFRISTGLDATGADLLAADPYAVLTEGATKGTLVGEAFVGGVECDHLAFRTDTVDWQIWVQKGEQPMPIKYVITTKWVTGAPQYTLRLSNWNVAPDVDDKLFSFTPPGDAKKIEQVYSDELGELTLEMAQ
jgi:hypothetical protein